ncbi:bifunctional YncE family protein/alkaline phosphatase family protein [Mucilaginibacter sp. KACC 22063]|uniref:bifunctional YncE family protein/alkaline phosphatase family protein n=1 Tax=Mucilaginibacter sp. KACC 22063 TaxID=3025666 RepID=UPI0023670592|nr:bifunctional YncE family protein/alkaline phosphatase family protein [Mucilaginibacter sp. KACC 22063]WDF55570.1 bifunctional YncE family protein/alkaline phosphatase family protein [Mucilaginibacter sp. KACC 22063]
MNRSSIIIKAFIIVAAFYSTQSFAQLPGKDKQTEQILLPNGWKLSPVGRSLPLGDLPLNMQLSKSGKLLAVTNNGQSTQTIQLIDPKKEKVLDEKEIGKSWYGLAFSNDEKHLYASGGNDNWIFDYEIKNNKLRQPDTISMGMQWPKDKISPAGMLVTHDDSRMYTVTKEDSSVYTIDLANRKILSRVQLSTIAYGCALSPDEQTLYVSLWGGNEVAVYNTASQTVTTTIKTGSHPNELLLNKKGTLLYVANANDNTVSVINTANNQVIETLSTTLYPTTLTGSTTNGLALSDNEKTLYIANADNNCLAVFDVSVRGNSKSQGFIPVGWYPTNVKVLGDKILVSNGKGFSSLPNPHGPQPLSKADNSGYQTGSSANSDLQYIAGLFKGTLSIIDAPNADQLKAYTKQVYANTPFNDKKAATADGEQGNPIPRRQGEKSPIKHVFYIIKENRTYDQVLGDMPKGNGDRSLCLFGSRITPNHHAIADEFVLLDNFYVDAEVSADGHNWSMAAYATDVVEKTWPTSYGKRGGTTNYEGGRPATYPKDGFIWDYCQRAGVTYRSYGEFGEFNNAHLKSLKGHMGPHSPGFDLDVTDQVRADAWEHDFDSLLTINAVPQLSVLRISNDHTSGQRKGKISPMAAVADNDLAIGRIIEHLSNSPVWKESVVFILEDDAQNGPDHIDAHRSPAFIAGPYVKRDAVVHSMYSTSGMLRTIELILGLPPMSQYDAAAKPFYECFTSKADLTPYKCKPALYNLNQRNVAENKSSKLSEKFDFSKEDAAPDLALNQIIWKSVKGEDAVMPAPKRSAFVILEKKKKDDDD